MVSKKRHMNTPIVINQNILYICSCVVIQKGMVNLSNIIWHINIDGAKCGYMSINQPSLEQILGYKNEKNHVFVGHVPQFITQIMHVPSNRLWLDEARIRKCLIKSIRTGTPKSVDPLRLLL